MKFILNIALILIITITGYSQAINKKTVIKDDSGNLVSFKKFTELLAVNPWTLLRDDSDINDIHYKLIKFSKENVRRELQRKEGLKSVNKKVFNFKFTDLNGTTISAENTKGKVVLLNFWFTSCPPCIKEIPDLNAIHTKYKDNPNVIFASVTFNKKDKIEAFTKKHPINFPIISTNEHKIHELKVTAYPTSIIIDKYGLVRYYYRGGRSDIKEKLIKGIENLLTK